MPLMDHLGRLGGSNIAPIILPVLAEQDTGDPPYQALLRWYRDNGVFGRHARDVWAEVTGKTPRSEPNVNMDRGTVLEPVMRELHEHVTGQKIRVPSEETSFLEEWTEGPLGWVLVPHLTYSPDGFVDEPLPAERVLWEGKTVGGGRQKLITVNGSPHYFRSWRPPKQTPPRFIEGIPLYVCEVEPCYLIQVQWGLYVLGLKKALLCGLFGFQAITAGLLYERAERIRLDCDWPGGWEPVEDDDEDALVARWTIEHLAANADYRIYPIDYDEDLGQFMEDYLSQWWDDYVVKDIPPPLPQATAEKYR